MKTKRKSGKHNFPEKLVGQYVRHWIIVAVDAEEITLMSDSYPQILNFVMGIEDLHEAYLAEKGSLLYELREAIRKGKRDFYA